MSDWPLDPVEDALEIPRHGALTALGFKVGDVIEVTGKETYTLRRKEQVSHESFAETYPDEVQYHYGGGYRDGAKAVLERIATEPWAREIDLERWRKEFVEEEEPVEPLPTEPFTVIEPHWKDGEGPSEPPTIRFALTLHDDGHWRGMGWWRDAATLQAQITGWELLSSPRNEANCVKRMEQVKRETEERIEGFKARIAQVEANNRALLDRQAEVMVETTQAVIERFREHVRGGLRPSMAVEQTLRDFNAAEEDEH